MPKIKYEDLNLSQKSLDTIATANAIIDTYDDVVMFCDNERNAE